MLKTLRKEKRLKKRYDDALRAYVIARRAFAAGTITEEKLDRLRENALNARGYYEPFNNNDYRVEKVDDSESDGKYVLKQCTEPVCSDITVYNTQRFWAKWPKEIEDNVPYASHNNGMGNGEERVFRLFGGALHGMRVRHDITLPSGKRCEVKSLCFSKKQKNTLSQAIRIADPSIVQLVTLNVELHAIMQDLNSFISAYDNCSDEWMQARTPKFRRYVEYVRSFLVENFLRIAGGDITKSTFLQLRKIINGIQAFEDVGWLKSLLQHAAFTSVEKYDELFGNISASNMLGAHADYVVMTNERLGFFVVPHERFDEMFEFICVSQGRAIFRFLGARKGLW